MEIVVEPIRQAEAIWERGVPPWEVEGADPKRAIENTVWESLNDSIAFETRFPDIADRAKVHLRMARAVALERGIDISWAERFGQEKGAEALRRLAESDALEASRGKSLRVPDRGPVEGTRQALAEGKTVPANVLADYPDLVR